MVAKNVRLRSNNDKLSLSVTAYSPRHGHSLMCSLMCLVLIGGPIRLFSQQSQPTQLLQGALEHHTLENRWLKVDLETSAGRLGRMRVQDRSSGKNRRYFGSIRVEAGGWFNVATGRNGGCWAAAIHRVAA